MSEEVKARLRDVVHDLRRTSLFYKGLCLSLGLILLEALDENALRAAIETVKHWITLTEESQVPTIDFMYPTRISSEAQGKNESVLLPLAGFDARIPDDHVWVERRGFGCLSLADEDAECIEREVVRCHRDMLGDDDAWVAIDNVVRAVHALK